MLSPSYVSHEEEHPLNFDFDAWAELARTDQPEFERRRRAAIEEVIARATPDNQPRLRALQWRIDVERQRAKTPLGACIKISSMMWDSFYKLYAVLNGLPSARHAAQAKRHAKVIPLRDTSSPGPPR
jgi:Protein of unknown function (DUF3135)